MNFEIIIKGLVQGVGFRPWVYRLAKAKGLSGDVRNSGGIVRVRILDTDEDAVKRFVSELKNKKPKEAIIESVEIKPAERTDTSAGFFIISSDDIRQGELADIPADIGVCSKCISEMKDMANRRYSYPYISCVSCGPRYSIMNRLPYDRENTTMSVYDM